MMLNDKCKMSDVGNICSGPLSGDRSGLEIFNGPFKENVDLRNGKVERD